MGQSGCNIKYKFFRVSEFAFSNNKILPLKEVGAWIN